MNRIRRVCSGFLPVAILAILLIPTRSFAATPEQVDAALEKAKAALYKQQVNGLWETVPKPTDDQAKKAPYETTGGQWGGRTALAVYALLASGEDPSDPKLATAIKFLRTAELKGTYALGVRAQLWPFLPFKDVRQEATNDAEQFANAMYQKGPTEGLFDYLLKSQREYTRFDHSVSQYGVLGMWACARAGVEVPTKFWEIVEDAWDRDQLADGSWCYEKAPSEYHPATLAMTVAGVATLFITQDYIHQTEGIRCTGNIDSPHINAGLKWIGDHFETVFTDHQPHGPYYGLYGVERVGVASGRKYLGDINWYERGSDYLIKNQGGGSWGDLPTTCFGMLFLARGRAPVIFNKLQYNVGKVEGNWDQRPRDIANLTHWISKNTERDLNWQIVNLSGTANDLLDAPVLYISGNKALQFTPKEEDKLREYCESGGLIMANSDCTSSEFSESFRKLGTHLFKEYPFRNLPLDHPIFTNEQYPRKSWKPAPTVLAVSNGVRELMILPNNSDSARAWQLEETSRNMSSYELADDIVLYAIDKQNLLEKGKTFVATVDPAIATNRVIKLARLQYAGNWNPEPGGWRRMQALLHNKSQIDLQISVANLGANQLGDGKTGAKVAVLTGTGTFKLDPAQRKEIKDFLDGGGTLIVDAAGGNSDFAAAVENELQVILGTDAGAQLKSALPATDKIFNLPGGVINEFTFRPFARMVVGSARRPLLCAASLNNRRAVYYSRQDLSAGIVGQPTDGIVGYDPVVATQIMTNLVVAGGLGDGASVIPPSAVTATPKTPTAAPKTPAVAPKPKPPATAPKATAAAAGQ